MRKKMFVEVAANFYTNGVIIPFLIKWKDGTVYEIDRVLEMRKAASLKAGGVGTRYTIWVKGSITYLFYEEPKWFVEAKV